MNLDPFVYWVEERERIRELREQGAAPPWTTDPLLANYRFCNVRREDDKVTVWIRQNIRERFADHRHLWWMLCAARQFNWPDTLAELISKGAWPLTGAFDTRWMTEVIAARLKRGEKVFTGAYIIRSEFGMPKGQSVSELALGGLWDNKLQLAQEMKGTLQQAHSALTKYRFWGPFMTYQAVVDMRFCSSLLAQAPDVDSWWAAGPGTIKGLNYFHGRPALAPLNQSRAIEEIAEFYGLLRNCTRVRFDSTDVPNILCEVHKYLKLQRGEGHVRAGYRPLGVTPNVYSTGS